MEKLSQILHRRNTHPEMFPNSTHILGGDWVLLLCDLRKPKETWQRRQWHPTPVLLPGESYGWRSLVGCSPRGCEESDMTELLHFHFSLSCIGEGNGNPLQCSCLEIPRDGGAWWAAVYGVTRSLAQSKPPITFTCCCC